MNFLLLLEDLSLLLEFEHQLRLSLLSELVLLLENKE
jgi:hypothetical protein